VVEGRILNLQDDELLLRHDHLLRTQVGIAVRLNVSMLVFVALALTVGQTLSSLVSVLSTLVCLVVAGGVMACYVTTQIRRMDVLHEIERRGIEFRDLSAMDHDSRTGSIARRLREDRLDRALLRRLALPALGLVVSLLVLFGMSVCMLGGLVPDSPGLSFLTVGVGVLGVVCLVCIAWRSRNPRDNQASQ